jgi:hypothetical protein
MTVALNHPPEKLEVLFFDDRPPTTDGEFTKSAAGLYEQAQDQHRIWIETSNLTDPLALVATIAHEVGHILLLGQGRISEEEEDHEPLTDLLTVFLGLGVLTANAVIRENYYTVGNVSGWNMSRRGYLTMLQYGYALAQFARARGEVNPPWARELRADVRDAFNKATTYLRTLDRPIVGSTATVSQSYPPHSHKPSITDDLTEGEPAGDEVAEGTMVCSSCGVVVATLEAEDRQIFCRALAALLGLALGALAGGDVGFVTHDGVDARVLALAVELDRPEEVAVVRHRHGIHALLFDELDQLRHPTSPQLLRSMLARWVTMAPIQFSA